MLLIPKNWTFESQKNGLVRVRQWLWWAEVYAGGFEQSGPYVRELWRRAIGKVWMRFRVRRVLILGLCAGDNVRLVQRYFGRVHVVVVEWDRAMIDMALGLKRFSKKNVEIMHGDLRDVLPTLQGPFDLILSDAFYGDTPDVGATSDAPGQALARILAPKGTYILNASRTPAAIDYVSRFLHLKKKWRFRDNTIAMFTK